MSRIVIWPYKMGSQSAKDLAKELGALRVYSNRNYRPRPTDIVINWGNSHAPNWDMDAPMVFLNPINAVNYTVNKIQTFQNLYDNYVSVLPFTCDRERAKQWLDEGDGIVCRTILTGHSGAGIVLVKDGNILPDAPLYTKLIQGEIIEYRVHVGINNYIFDYAQKKKRRETDVDPYIRTHENGWVFCRNGIELPGKVRYLAENVQDYLGLHFCNVDILYDSITNKAYIIEVNSAPALMGSTLTSYTEMFREFIHGTNN